MSWLRRFYRVILLISMILIGVVITVAMTPAVRGGIPNASYKSIRQWWLGQVAAIAGVRIQVIGQPVSEPTLWVGNHISWMDIPVLGGLAPVGFLSKDEVRTWPVIGWLAKQAGTLFIVRGEKDASVKARQELERHLQQEHSIVLFPEGTTTDGRNVRRFHARPLAPALDAGLKIQPVVIRYPDAAGQPNLDVPYIDEDTIVDSATRIFGKRRTLAEVRFLDPVDCSDFESRKALAAHLQEIISANLGYDADDPV